MPQSVLYLVRHGISEWNLLKKWQGQVDTNLAPVGVEQAKIRGENFKNNDVRFDEAYTSDLKRASHTCQLLMNSCGVSKTVNPDERLRECSLGEFEGMHKSDIYGEKYAELWSYLGSLSHETRIRTPYFEGLETPLDVATRAGQCLLESLMNLDEEEEPRTILAVTHSTVIESLLASLFGADFDSIHTDNLCWIRFKVEQSRLVMDGSEGVSYKVSPDAIPLSPSCMSSFQLCGLKTLIGGSAGLLLSLYLSQRPQSISSTNSIVAEGNLNYCEGNFLVSEFVGEFFNTLAAALVGVSGLHTALQFNFKHPHENVNLDHRQRNAQMLALSVGAAGSSLAYAHAILDSGYMNLSLALCLWTGVFAVFTSGKGSHTGTEMFRSLTLFAVFYFLHWKMGSQPLVLYTMILLTLSLYVSRLMLLLRKTKDPRTRVAFVQGMIALLGGVLLFSLDSYLCTGFGQVVTMRALGYASLSGATQLILASFIELTTIRAWIHPSVLFNIWIPSLKTFQDDHIAQK